MSNWRQTREYRLWRVRVIRRDKVCQICGERKMRHAHHVNHASYFPNMRFDIQNGVCLCVKCHSQYHNNFHRNTRVKCTEYDFKNFVALTGYIKDLK